MKKIFAVTLIVLFVLTLATAMTLFEFQNGDKYAAMLGHETDVNKKQEILHQVTLRNGISPAAMSQVNKDATIVFSKAQENLSAYIEASKYIRDYILIARKFDGGESVELLDLISTYQPLTGGDETLVKIIQSKAFIAKSEILIRKIKESYNSQTMKLKIDGKEIEFKVEPIK